MKKLMLTLLMFMSTYLVLSAQPISYISYTVKAGDNLYQLSNTYGVNIDAIMQQNPRVKKGQLNIGDVIILPLKQKGGTSTASNDQTMVYLHDDVVANAGVDLLPLTNPVVQEDAIARAVSDIIAKPTENAAVTEPIIYATPLHYVDDVATFPSQPVVIKEDPIYRGIEETNQPLTTYSSTITEANTNTSTSTIPAVTTKSAAQVKGSDKEVTNTSSTSGTPRTTSYTKLKPVRHKVKEKETLYSIAKLYNQEVTTLLNWNNLTDNNIKSGQDIIIEYIMPTNEALTMLELAEISKVSAESSLTTPFQKTYTEFEQDTLGMFKLKKHTGAAIWFDDSGETSSTDNMYCLHKYAPPKTIVKVTNPINRRTAYLMVVEKLPDLPQNDNVLLSMTHSAAKRLNILNDKLMVESRYYMPK